MIKVGVSSCFLYPDIDRPYFGPKTLNYLENDMAKYLYTNQSLPILIPKLDKDDLLNFLGEMDCFVFQGGSDMCPQSYNKEFLDKDKWPGDPIRDEYELFIMDYAFKNKKPVLGICRGFQLINTYFKGTLYQDIQTQVSGSLEHRNALEYDKISHSVSLEKDSLLQQLYQSDCIQVNSVHHQAIETLGEGLIIEAISKEDSLIEAFRYKNMKENFVWAVQWHPEFFHTIEEKLCDANILYQHFLKEVRKKK